MAVVRAVLPYRQDEDDLPQRTAGHSMGGSGRLRAGAGSGREAREHGASVAYRRFPALAQFTDEELAAITMPPQPFPGMTPSPSVAQLGGSDELGSGEAGRTRADEETMPFSALSSFRAAVIKKGSHDQPYGSARSRPQAGWRKPRLSSSQPPAPFRPVNPSGARESITDRFHGYITMHTPYDAVKEAERSEKLASAAAQRSGPFRPSSSAQAKSAIRVHYFLNSPDTETFQAERQFIKERAERNRQSYNREARTKLLLLREREKKKDAELRSEAQ